MKSNKLFFGVLTLLAFTACSDDKNTAPDDTINNGSESFINVRIFDVNSLTSKAPAFENGNEHAAEGYDESAIKSLTIAFYSTDKKFITTGTASEIDFKAPNQTNGGNIETVAEVTVKLKLKPTDPVPAWAIAFANPIDGSDASLGDIATTRKRPRTAFCTSATVDDKTVKVFAMNNSVYFDASNNEVVATPVTRANFFQGTNSGGVPAVDFYIERIAGKVVLRGNNASDNTKLPFKEDEKYKLIGENGAETEYSFVFVPKKWCLNAEEKKTNLMKDFKEADYATLNSNLKWGTDGLWNDPTRKRSYWTRSLTWNNATIPDVSDDVDTDAEKEKCSLVYHTYQDAITNGVKVGTPCYTFENTKQSSYYNNNAALVSAVIVGEYELRGSNDQPLKDGDKLSTFYRRNGQFFSLKGYYSKMAAAQRILGTVSGETFTALSAADLEAVTKINHPASTAADKYMENEVTIVFDKTKAGEKLTDLYVRTAENTYTKYNDLTIEDEEVKNDKDLWINKQLLKQCGLTEAYTNGKAYFNIPIRHLGIETTTTDETTKKETTTLSPGYYGIVRNHTYDITVTEVQAGAFGNGVFSETKPIVPPTKTDDYNFKANINVHAWRVVTHTVTIGKE